MTHIAGLGGKYLEYLQLTNYARSTIYHRSRVIVRFRTSMGFDALDASEDQMIGWWTGLNITPYSRATELSHLRAYIRWAVRHGHIAADPSRLLDRPRIGRRYPRPMDELSFGRALAAAPAHILAILCLAGYGGLRACEISALEWNDIHGSVLLLHGKGSKERIIPMHDAIRDALDQLPGKRRGPVIVTRALFVSGGVKPHTVCHWANSYLHEMGIPETLHQLRHRFGTQLFQVTLDIRLCQDLLGHASIDTTALYTAWDRTEAAGAVARLPRPA
jgi:integrase